VLFVALPWSNVLSIIIRTAEYLLILHIKGQMDPLSIAVSVISIVDVALKSCNALQDLVEDLVTAQATVSNIMNEITAVRSVLGCLKDTLNDSEATILGPLLQRTQLELALRGCSTVCDQFAKTLNKYTQSSPDGRLSRRARLIVTFRKSKIKGFLERLSLCKATVALAMESVML
jgi:hypothetical protein